MLLNANKIKQIRHQQGWTQEQLAQLCDVSVRTVQRIEKSGVASMETTNALAAVMNVERETLLMTEGVAPGRTELPIRLLIMVGSAAFAIGISIGLAF